MGLPSDTAGSNSLMFSCWDEQIFPILFLFKYVFTFLLALLVLHFPLLALHNCIVFISCMVFTLSLYSIYMYNACEKYYWFFDGQSSLTFTDRGGRRDSFTFILFLCAALLTAWLLVPMDPLSQLSGCQKGLLGGGGQGSLILRWHINVLTK